MKHSNMGKVVKFKRTQPLWEPSPRSKAEDTEAVAFRAWGTRGCGTRMVLTALYSRSMSSG